MKPQMEAETMGPYILNAISWIFAIRGHIPQDGDFHPGPGDSSLGSTPTRMLAAFVAVVVVLTLALWVAVWLAIKLL